MIVKSLCNTCFQQYELLLQTSDIGLVRQVADEQGMTVPCPRLCGGRTNIVGDSAIESLRKGAQLKDPIHLTGLQLYRAVLGAGLPDEIPKNKDVIESLLKAKKVTDVLVEESNSRFYLHEIHLEDGIVVHLSAGAPGAQVLKITKERQHGPSHPG